MFFRNLFKINGNILFLLLFFVVIGLILHYKGETRPLVSLWNDFKTTVFGDDRSSNRPNPYKAPEPDIATDDRRPTAKSKPLPKIEETTVVEPSSDNEGAIEEQTATPTRYDFTKIKDFYLPAIGSNDQIVRHSRITLRYREQHEQADWVAYKLTGDEARAYLSRDGNQFMPDRDVATGSATTSDYTRSGYDRGHLAPAGDFNLSARDKRETFYMSNISPQEKDFNRGIWSDLEQKFRDWAQRDEELYVVTGPVLKSGLETIGHSNEISVPEQFYKIALCLTDKKPRMIAFLMNNEFSNESLRSFVVSVDEVERLTGIDFFSRLPDDIEKRLEAKSVVTDWFSGFGRSIQ